VRNVVEDLAGKGFRVLDTKPNHVILRKRTSGELLRRRGRLTYALVDFELLQRTEEYEHWRAGGGSRTAKERATARRKVCTGASRDGCTSHFLGRHFAKYTPRLTRISETNDEAAHPGKERNVER
jgi:hypothetical protein